MNKNILILTQPRSGSHWLQSCLSNHYDLGEFFNVRNIESFELLENFAKPSLYKEDCQREDVIKSKLQERFSIYDQIQKIKSVKVHKFHIDQTILDWISKNDLYIINLERKDKVKQLKSLLIANHIKKFFGQLPKIKIEIKYHEFLECQSALSKNSNIHKDLGKSYCDLYYEDLLDSPKKDWFDPKKSRHVRQNSSETIEIINWEEVLEWSKSILKY